MGLLTRLARLAAKEAERTAPRAVERAAEAAPRAVAKAERVVARPARTTTAALAAKPRALPKPQPVKALPAPPKPLALPAPGPGLPDYAAKPRGGQWWPDATIGETDPLKAGYRVHDRGPHQQDGWRYALVDHNNEPVGQGAYGRSPEAVLQAGERYLDREKANWSPEAAARYNASELTLYGPWDVGEAAVSPQDWLQRALTKYYKNDFGAPTDPLRDLAARGLHYDPEMTPERWLDTVNRSLAEDDIGSFTVPPHMSGAGADDYQRAYGPPLVELAPWLAKQPVTDKLYGIKDPLDLGHFTDEFNNALYNPDIPTELAVRPEMLGRMSFPQAVERVGRINQWRAKEMERAALSALESPAVQTFKEYPEDNPLGLRWVELKHPGFELPEGWTRDADVDEQGPLYHYVVDETGKRRGGGMTPEKALHAALAESELDTLTPALRDALKYEGDTMGHCVGGYCDDVLEGRSRIFSLRDAKGEPHVTVETRPGGPKGLSQAQVDDLWRQAEGQVDPNAFADDDDAYFEAVRAQRDRLKADWIAAQQASAPEDIVQIKGKQNRAPKDDYLPFVQDFVKSGQWGNVGDLANAQLNRLPDGRYITEAQLEEGIGKFYEQGGRKSPYFRQPENWEPEDWASLQPFFEGYAVGGRVSADRCFSRNPLAARAA